MQKRLAYWVIISNSRVAVEAVAAVVGSQQCANGESSFFCLGSVSTLHYLISLHCSRAVRTALLLLLLFPLFGPVT